MVHPLLHDSHLQIKKAEGAEPGVAGPPQSALQVAPESRNNSSAGAQNWCLNRKKNFHLCFYEDYSGSLRKLFVTHTHTTNGRTFDDEVEHPQHQLQKH